MRTIAYLGPVHTNTHLAARAKFGSRSRYLHAPTIEEVFHLVERRQADYGVVPVENSLAGAVAHTLDRFIDFVDTPVRIHGEIEQPIRHCLIVHPNVRISELRVIYSHPQAFTQCHRWLTTHLPQAQRWETNSTAEAVVYVMNKAMGPSGYALRQRGAIGTRELANEHHLRAISIPEERENRTRFLVLGLGAPRRGARNKTSVLFALKDAPGALHDALVPFKHNHINLTKIESRPSRRKAWEYLFFIDLEGHETAPQVKRALATLKVHTSLFRVLGSYPSAT